MTASSLLVFGTLLAMPLLASAIATGVAVDPRLTRAAEAGAVIFVAMIALGVWCVVRDKPLEVIGKVAQATRNRLVRKREPITSLPRLLREGATPSSGCSATAGGRRCCSPSGRWVLDYLTLLAALYRSAPSRERRSSWRSPSLPAQLLGTLPLARQAGFVEAGLTGTLALAGVPAGAAVVAASPTGSSRSGYRSPRARSRRSSTNAGTEMRPWRRLEEGIAREDLRARQTAAARERG